MAQRRVVSSAQLPMRLPIWSTVVLWLVLDRYPINPVTLGVIWTVWSFFAIGCCCAWWNQRAAEVAWKDEA